MGAHKDHAFHGVCHKWRQRALDAEKLLSETVAAADYLLDALSDVEDVEDFDNLPTFNLTVATQKAKNLLS